VNDKITVFKSDLELFFTELLLLHIIVAVVTGIAVVTVITVIAVITFLAAFAIFFCAIVLIVI
jgi:hypothetical protein